MFQLQVSCFKIQEEKRSGCDRINGMGQRPTELLAPAGNWECARAAVANGADAIYFGMPRFNARIRADNFTPDDLPELMRFLHEHGVRGFVAFNVLVFPAELEAAADQLRLLSEAGVDAIIVQDLGLATMARAIVPDLNVHASTQMTITSPEALAFADELFDLDRAVIARENSMREIHLFHANEPDSVELETFVHGALCVAYSGQCLTSESLGQRSANRGECAQACRMPYELVVDGKTREMGDQKYLLSPQDLAGIDQIPELIRLGVVSFKIEGRLKTPEYVAAVTRAYRKAIDAAQAGENDVSTPEDHYELEMAFSRGLSTGWLKGIDNKKLVHARFGKKRGAYVGRVRRTGDDWVEFEGDANVINGDGIVFDTGGNTDREQGGRVYGVEGDRLMMKRGQIDFSKVRAGDRIWKTDDPALNAELQKTFKRETLPPRKKLVHWTVRGRVGEELVISDSIFGESVSSLDVMSRAENRPLNEEVLTKQLSRLGNTVYELGGLTVDLEGEVMCPMSELNRLRRALVEKLDRARGEKYAKRRVTGVSVSELLPEIKAPASEGELELRVLCRTEEQVDAAVESGIETLYVDLEDVRRYKELVKRVRANHPETKLFLATPRIQKAGEAGLFRVVEKAKPDGVLVRNLGGVNHFRDHADLMMVGDFSLNVSNPISASRLMDQGMKNLTISYDLNIEQVLDLLGGAPPEWFELTFHQHMPMFHMEHCVFCTFLSEGTDFTNCGRPCDKHEVQLRDRVGQLHPLKADVGCRNTLFNGRAQSGAGFMAPLRESGLQIYRVELLGETAGQTSRLIGSYRGILAGERGASELPYDSRIGVVEGTLEAR
ncbi:MAG: U32 family peptidase [Verrucomicrobiales bacterium]|nr:U32 family peptidase [Verrucomicrobiales bacterium]